MYDVYCKGTIITDPGGYQSVRALLLGGGHGGVHLDLLRAAGHAAAAGLGLLPAGGQWDELCALMVQGGDTSFMEFNLFGIYHFIIV